MREISYTLLVMYIFFYSFIGWLLEVIYCSIAQRKLANRGIMYGPYSPVYGIGALFVILLPENLSGNPVAVFIIVSLSATVIEYCTSWLLEKLFQARWWDHSDERLNLHGRICVTNTVYYGLLGLLTAYVLQPFISSVFLGMSTEAARIIASVIVVIFLCDMVFTLNTLTKIIERVKSLHIVFDKITAKTDERADETGLPEYWAKSDKQRVFRLLKSFPNLKFDFNGMNATLKWLRENRIDLSVTRDTLRNIFWKNTRRIGKKTVESTKSYLDEKFSLYKLFWVFVTACVIGYVVETLFCLVKNGYIESRQGLLYGPFSQVYGLGAVLMVVTLVPLAKKSDRWLFIGSAVLGGAFEYLCSYIQEVVFNSVSWEYSAVSFNINGRTNLTYMLFWGVLGMVFIKDIYPRLSRIINRIPKRQGFFITVVLAVFLSADIIISGIAVIRWNDRLEGNPAKNGYERFLDRQYPDEVMEEIYPNLMMMMK